MDENLKSMGDTGKVDFKEEVKSQETVKKDVVSEDTNKQEVSETNTKTVEDVIKEKEKEEQMKKEEEIVKTREEEAIKKAEEFFGYKQEELEESIKSKEEASNNSEKEDIEWKAMIEKAKQAVEAARRVTAAYEEKEKVILSENKKLKTDNLEKDIEIKSLRAKIEEMANDRANDSNNHIKSNDMRLRYLANIRNRRAENPEDQSLKAKEVEYFIDELSIHVPHITPEQLRKFIAKKEESIEVMPEEKIDYKHKANKIAEDVTENKKRESIFKAISPKRISYDNLH